MIAWYLGLIGIIFGIIGGIYFFKFLLSSPQQIKKGLAFLVIASFIYIILNALIISFKLLNYNLDHIYWQTVPIIFLISAIFFTIGSIKLVRLIKRISGKERKKVRWVMHPEPKN